MGLQNPSVPSVLSQLFRWRPHDQFKGWLRAPPFVFVRLLQSLSGDSYIRLLSASTSWHPQWCLSLETVYVIDPQVEQFLDGLSFSLCSTLCLHICSCVYFIHPSKRHWSIHILVFLLRLHMVIELNLWYSQLLVSYPLISEYIPCVCSFVTELPYSGWYFQVLSICLRISRSHCF